MPNRCDVLDKKPGRGHSVSHSNIKSKRSWRVTMFVSAKGIRTIDKRGIESVVAEMRRDGKKV